MCASYLHATQPTGLKKFIPLSPHLGVRTAGMSDILNCIKTQFHIVCITHCKPRHLITPSSCPSAYPITLRSNIQIEYRAEYSYFTSSHNTFSNMSYIAFPHVWFEVSFLKTRGSGCEISQGGGIADRKWWHSRSALVSNLPSRCLSTRFRRDQYSDGTPERTPIPHPPIPQYTYGVNIQDIRTRVNTTRIWNEHEATPVVGMGYWPSFCTLLWEPRGGTLAGWQNWKWSFRFWK